MSHHDWLWIIFAVAVPVALAIDLGVANRRAHEIRIREALAWSAFWIALALAFNLLVWKWEGHRAGLEFLTGYLVEKSLSVDNLFVFLMLFSFFGVERRYQHKVLFWGILGAVVMRGMFIYAGVTLMQTLHWLVYALGAFLVVTGAKMALKKGEEVHPDRNPVLRLFRRFMPVTNEFEGGRFFVRRAGRLMATPLFVVVLVVETTDVVFAVDSIPAILGITTDMLVVYTSNIFAILGLRALFFALAGFMQLFHHLHYGLSLILVFIGAKMIAGAWVKVPVGVALGVVAGILVVSVATSLMFPGKPEKAKAE